VRECDAIARIYAAADGRTPDFAGTSPPCRRPSWPRDASRASHVERPPLRRDETVALELAGACAITRRLARTMQLGRPAPKVLDTAKAVLEGRRRCWRPCAGVTGEDVSGLAGRHRPPCLKEESRIGYSIGLGYRPIGASYDQLAPGRPPRARARHVLHSISACG